MSNDNPTIRRLVRGDEELAEKLNALFARVFDDHATYLGHPPGRDYLDQFLGREEAIVVVSLVAGEIVGGIVAYELLKLESVRPEIYLYDVAVDGAHRRRGIATSLIEELKRIARSRDASVVYVQADYGDDAPIALYRKLGAQEEVLHFDLRL